MPHTADSTPFSHDRMFFQKNPKDQTTGKKAGNVFFVLQYQSYLKTKLK